MTFTLKGIDPSKLIKLYLSSHTIDVSGLPKIDISTGPTKVIRRVEGHDLSSVYYTMKNSSGGYDVFTTSGKNPPKSCWHCRRTFDEQKNDSTVPIPLHVTKSFSEGGMKCVFYVEGRTCDFSCALAFVEDSRGMYDINLFRYFLNYCHPGKTVNKAGDFRLLDVNGGSMTSEEYDNMKKGTLTFKRTSNINIMNALPAYKEQ